MGPVDGCLDGRIAGSAGTGFGAETVDLSTALLEVATIVPELATPTGLVGLDNVHVRAVDSFTGIGNGGG